MFYYSDSLGWKYLSGDMETLVFIYIYDYN